MNKLNFRICLSVPGPPDPLKAGAGDAAGWDREDQGGINYRDRRLQLAVSKEKLPAKSAKKTDNLSGIFRVKTPRMIRSLGFQSSS